MQVGPQLHIRSRPEVGDTGKVRPRVDPRDCTIFTVPQRFAELGDLHADIDDHVFDLAPLLEWAERDELAGAEPPAEPDPDEGPDGATP